MNIKDYPAHVVLPLTLNKLVLVNEARDWAIDCIERYDALF